jgi:hypothetical protein
MAPDTDHARPRLTRGLRAHESPAEGAPSPVDTVGVAVEFDLPTSVEAIDNRMLWASTPPRLEACGGG